MMSYIDLINNFWRLDFEKRFSLIQTRYYFLLLHYANKRHWKEALSLSNSRLQQEVNCSETGLKKARRGLVKRELIWYKKGQINVAGKYYIRYNPEYFIGSLKGPSIIDNKEFLKNENGERSREQSSEQNSDRNGEQNREQSENGTSYIRQDKIREEEKMKKNGKEMEKEEKDLLHPHHLLHLKIINLYNKTCKDLPAFDALSVGLIEELIEKRNKYLKNTEGWTNFFNKVHESDFLNNRIADKQFLANLKWILEKDNFDKIMVGSFDKSFDKKNYRTDFYMSNKEKFKKAAEERRKREQLNG